MDMLGRDASEDETLGLNCAWYADMLMTLTAQDGPANLAEMGPRPGRQGSPAPFPRRG
jgi:hypothetical protein